MKPTHDLTGVLPVFQTPFHEDESIDFESLGREIDWLFRQGANGIVMAMVSETLRLSSEERDDLAAAVCRCAGPRGPVVISIGAESTSVALRHARHAEAWGASAVMAIPPIATACDEAQLVTYFRRILLAIDIPLIVQDASGYVGRPLPIETLARLLNEFGPARVLFKPEAVPIGPRLTALRDATQGKARVFEGSGGIALVDSYRRGVVGTMPGADLVATVVALWRALVANKSDCAAELGPLLTDLVSLQQGLDGFLAIEKYLLVRQGVLPNARVRGPVGFQLDHETRAEVDRRFDVLTAALEKHHDR
jgi:dihydrodipicolinate synthase/N-acetylneuraminate lyase